MSYLKVLLSKISGKVPTVNDLDLESIGINSADGLAWIKKKTEAGVESIVPLNGGGGSGGVDSFIELEDTPSSYSGQSLKGVRVNSAENGLEFFDVPSGGSGLTSVTYAELVALISASGLTPGAQYLISDFATVHFMVTKDSSGYVVTIPDAINTGTTEPIVVTAYSTNKLHSIAKSTLHEKDILHYDFNPQNWINDVAFAYPTGSVEDMVTGFKGVITYREDTKQGVSAWYDFRAVKFRRYSVDADDYDSATTYQNNAYVTYDGKIYRSVKFSNLNNTPDSSPTWWFNVSSNFLDFYPYISWSDTSIIGLTANSADFEDYFTFLYYATVRNVKLGRAVVPTVYVDYARTTMLPCNVFLNSEEYMLENCDFTLSLMVDNTFTPISWRNLTISGLCDNNVMGGNMIGNYVDVQFNFKIGGSIWGKIYYLYANFILGNLQGIIATEFNENIIFGSLQKVSAVRFYANFIPSGKSMSWCNFNYFAGNTIAVNFIYVNGSCAYVDFTGATVVTGSYDKDLVRSNGGTNRVRYINNSGTQVIALANA